MSFYGSIYANPSAVYDNTKAIEAEVENRIDADNKINEEINNCKSAIKTEQTNRENEDTSIKNTISDLAASLETEKRERETSDDSLISRIDTIEKFFKEEELEQGIDTLKEIQKYIEADGEAAAKMLENIGKNAAAISKNANAISEEITNRDTAIREIKEDIIGNVPEDKTVVDLIEEAESTAEEKINALDEQIQTNTDAIKSINNTIGDTSGNENSLIDSINANAKNIAGIKEDIGNYESPFSIAERLDNLEDSSGGGVDSGLTAQVQANTQNIESIKNIIGINDNIVLNDTIINILKQLEEEINKNKLIINQSI